MTNTNDLFQYLLARIAQLNKQLHNSNKPNYNFKENDSVRSELIDILEKFYNMKREYLLTLGVK